MRGALAEVFAYAEAEMAPGLAAATAGLSVGAGVVKLAHMGRGSAGILENAFGHQPGDSKWR